MYVNIVKWFKKIKFSTLNYVSANTGGLLGLFMGFSVVSFIEIIYFMSLRPYCARKRYSNHVEKSSSINEKLVIVEPARQSNYTNVISMNGLQHFTKFDKKFTNNRESMLTNLKNRAFEFATKIRSTFKEKISDFGNYTKRITTVSNKAQEYEPRYPYTE